MTSSPMPPGSAPRACARRSTHCRSTPSWPPAGSAGSVFRATSCRTRSISRSIRASWRWPASGVPMRRRCGRSAPARWRRSPSSRRCTSVFRIRRRSGAACECRTVARLPGLHQLPSGHRLSRTVGGAGRGAAALLLDLLGRGHANCQTRRRGQIRIAPGSTPTRTRGLAKRCARSSASPTVRRKATTQPTVGPDDDRVHPLAHSTNGCSGMVRTSNEAGRPFSMNAEDGCQDNEKR